MSKYLIKLKPVDTFFFSQENKYRKKKGKYEAEYFQRSGYFPQQTTLIGMLRYYILLINGQIPITDKSKAESLIGKESFHITNKPLDFKMIKNISEVFIIDKENKKYIPNPKDYILKKQTQRDKEKTIIKRLEKNNLDIKTNFTDHFSYFPEFVEKEGISRFLFHKETDWLPYDYDEKENPHGVFIKLERIGITKAKGGKTLDNGFYKQVFYKINNPYSFGIIAEFDDDFDLDKTIKFPFVPMGTEKNIFHITFENADKLQDIDIKTFNQPKIVLMSDAYIENHSHTDYDFAISQTKTFRFLETKVTSDSTYYSKDPLLKRNNSIQRSQKFNLFEAGSVFYFNDEKQMDKFYNKINNENFKKIGYNKTLKIF